jgi:transposase
MGVIIGMDPHKLSATIEVLDAVHGQFIGLGCYGTDREGYVAMLAAVRGRFPQRVWAVEGCNGVGRHHPSWNRQRAAPRTCLNRGRT